MATSKRQTATAEDRRSAQRQVAIKRGVVITEVECAVFEVSKTGARILIPSAANFPETFKLAVDSGPAKLCRVVWRKGNEFGIEFTNAHQVAKEASHNARRAMRERLFDKAVIVYNDGFCTMNCDVMDYSTGGARLKPLNPRDCPAYFQLRIKYGPTHNCVTLRRTGREIAVRFLPS